MSSVVKKRRLFLFDNIGKPVRIDQLKSTIQQVLNSRNV